MRTIRILSFLAIALLTLSATAAAAGRDEPSGHCESPRDAVLQLLYWQMPATYNPASAGRCLDTEGVADSQDALRIQKHATALKRVLDLQNLYVDPTSVPDDPAYVNEASGEAQYTFFPDAFKAFAAVKKEERWLIAAEAVAMAPDLYQKLSPFDLDALVGELPSWTQHSLMGVHLWQVLALFAFFFIAIVLQRVVLYAIGVWLARIDVTWFKDAIQTSRKPVSGLLIAAVATIVLPMLHFTVTIHTACMVAVRVLATFSAVWLAYRLTEVVAIVMEHKAEETETKLDDQLVPLVRKSLKVMITIIGGLFILQNLDVDVGSLIAGLGLGGLAFALAAKDTVANFFGSVMIFIDRPFQVGDAITMGDVEGVVEEVGFRTTKIRTFYNSVITVPNARVTDSAIDNLGLRQMRRYRTTLLLTYDTPPEKITAFCEGVRNLVHALPGTKKDSCVIEFTGLGDSGLELIFQTFVNTTEWARELRTKHNLNLGILTLAAELGVEFAFPTQSLHIESVAPTALKPTLPHVDSTRSSLDSISEGYGPAGNRFGELPLRRALEEDPEPPETD